MRYFLLFLVLSSSVVNAQFAENNFVIEDDSANVIQNETKIEASKNKNVLDVFISLVIPGWSFFKKKEYVKGATFVAVDIAAISGCVYFNKKGDEELERSEKFADKYYSTDKFEEFSDTIIHSDDFLLNPHIIPYSDSIGHVFKYDENGKVIKDLNYYEMIGKYQKFAQGWSDVSMNYKDIVKKYGNIYIPQMKGDSVRVYNSKFPASNNTANYLQLKDDNSSRYVLQNEMTERDFSMMVPLENFYFGQSQHALHYMEIRDRSNTYNQYADMMLWVIAVNHLTSFGFSIYHMITDNKIEPQAEEKVSKIKNLRIYPVVNLEEKSRGVNLQWSF